MTDSTASDLDDQAREVLRAWGQPKRRARSRVSRALHDAQDCEVTTSAGPVAAWRLGDGPAVLLVHGWEDDNALWGPLIDRFARNGKAVVAHDLPGHGFTQSAGSAGDDGGAAAELKLLDPWEHTFEESGGWKELQLREQKIMLKFEILNFLL